MYPDAAQITLIQDNLSAHKKAALYDILPPARARAIIQRLHIVFTPKHGSWLNVAEIELTPFRLKFCTFENGFSPDRLLTQAVHGCWL